MYCCVQSKHFYINSFTDPFGCCVRKIHIPLSNSIFGSKETRAYCVLTPHIYFCPLSHTTEKVKAFFSLSLRIKFIYRCSTDSTSSQVNALKTRAHCDCTTFFLVRCLCAQNYLLSVFPDPRFPEKRCLGFMSRITLSPSPFLA